VFTTKERRNKTACIVDRRYSNWLILHSQKLFL